MPARKCSAAKPDAAVHEKGVRKRPQMSRKPALRGSVLPAEGQAQGVGEQGLAAASCWQRHRATSTEGARRPFGARERESSCGRASRKPSPEPSTLLRRGGAGGKGPVGQRLLTLSLECRLQDTTVCFLGRPRGRLPLFRLCTSFSCSLETVTSQGAGSPVRTPSPTTWEPQAPKHHPQLTFRARGSFSPAPLQKHS